MVVFISMIIVAMVYLISNHQKPISEIFTNLYRTLVEQSVPSFSRIITKSSISLYILIFIWLITISCISRSLKSILLNTYFKTKPSLTVYTLEDIVNRPDISITGSFNLDTLKQFKPKIYNDLSNRAISYEKRIGINYTTREGSLVQYSKSVVQKVVNREAVIIADTYGIDLFKKMNPMYKLMESDVKYAQLFVYIVVHKNIPHNIRINKL